MTVFARPGGLVRAAGTACAALLALTLVGPSHAQSAPGEPKPMTGNGSAPDVVRLKNGGLLRGTISELVPGASVVLVTATGDVRRFPMSEVEYAGPAAGLPGANAPAPAAAPARAADGRVTLNLRATAPEVTFHQRIASGVTTGASVGFGVGVGGGGASGGSIGVSPYSATSVTYAPLCLAPCQLAMTPGTYYLGLSLEDGSPVSDNRPIVIAPNSTEIMGSYKSYEPLRTAGWLLGGASFIGGASLAVWASVSGAETCSRAGSGCSFVPDDRVAPLAAGVAILVGGGIVAYILSSIQDDVSVTVQ